MMASFAGRSYAEALFWVQLSVVGTWLIVVWLLAYVLKIEFRSLRPALFAFVTLFFAAAGAAIGIASIVGTAWMITAIALFFAARTLASIQRSVTGE